MKKITILVLLFVVVFSVGFWLGQQRSSPEKVVRLRFAYDKGSGLITAYTFYLDSNGNEVKHGDSYEVDTSGRIDVRGKYDHGKVVGGMGRFN